MTETATATTPASPANDPATWSAFKKAQVRYRRIGQANNNKAQKKGKQQEDPDVQELLAELVDFSAGLDCRDPRIVDFRKEDFIQSEALGNTFYRGPLFGMKGFDGLVYMPQALSPTLQETVAHLSVSRYCQKPHTTNIHLHPPKASETDNSGASMWNLWKKQNEFATSYMDDQQHDLEEEQEQPPKPQKRSRHDAASTSQKTVNEHNLKYYCSFQKLSWATMGYHYDWTSRSYDENAKSKMPALIANISRYFAQTCMRVTDGNANKQKASSDMHEAYSFIPSASIVNYYNPKSVMGGHRDDLELAMDKPIISISVGCPAIFLLGGVTKEDEPVIPILIRPGDILCMGGKARLYYHGMARMLPPSQIPVQPPTPYGSQNDFDDAQGRSHEGGSWWPMDIDNFMQDGQQQLHQISPDDRRALEEYLKFHRININVRQVYPDDNLGQRENFA